MHVVPVFDLVARNGACGLEQQHVAPSAVSHIRSAADLRAFLAPLSHCLSSIPYEIAGIIMLDLDNRVIGISKIASGTRTSVPLPAEQIVLRALCRQGCTAVIVVHTHLRERAEPSQEDFAAFRQLRAELPAFLHMMDFVIWTERDVYSYQEHGHFRSLPATRSGDGATGVPHDVAPHSV